MLEVLSFSYMLQNHKEINLVTRNKVNNISRINHAMGKVRGGFSAKTKQMKKFKNVDIGCDLWKS